MSRESHRLGLARAASNWPKPAIVGLLLALAIVRRIMETHGGSFRLDNRREDGARATLQFNLEPKKAV